MNWLEHVFVTQVRIALASPRARIARYVLILGAAFYYAGAIAFLFSRNWVGFGIYMGWFVAYGGLYLPYVLI